MNRANRACALPGGRRGKLSEDSLVSRASLFVCTEIHEIETKEVQVLLCLNTAVTREQLGQRFPGAIGESDSAQWNPRERRAEAVYVLRYRDLVLESRSSGAPSEALAAEILARPNPRG